MNSVSACTRHSARVPAARYVRASEDTRWDMASETRAFRLPGCRRRRQAGAGRRRLPQRRAPLRPDERPDVGRTAPRLEGRAGHGRQPAAETTSRSRCSISRAAPATSRSGWSRPAAPAPESPCSISTPTCWKSAGTRAAERGLDDAIAFVDGNAEALPFPDGRFDAVTIAFGIRNVPRIEAALAEASACCGSAGISSAWNSRPSTCRGSPRCTTSIPSTRSRRWADGYGRCRGLSVSGRIRSATFREPDAFADMMRTAGFGRVSFQRMSGGIVALHSGWRL